ncbi:cytochrome P450 2F3-like [Gastrophryne carolinensis]
MTRRSLRRRFWLPPRAGRRITTVAHENSDADGSQISALPPASTLTQSDVEGGIMEWSSAILLILIFGVSYILLLFKRLTKERAALPPGPLPLPIVGNLLQIDSNKFITSLMELKEKYGSVYTLYLGPRPGIVICGYDAVKEALVDQNDVFGDRGRYPVFQDYLGFHDIAFNNGESWKPLRRFTLLTLRNFGMGKKSLEMRVVEDAQRLIKEFEKAKGLDLNIICFWHTGEPINPKSLISQAVFSVICSVIYGSRLDDKKLEEITDHINTIFLILSSIWGRLYNAYPTLMQYLPGRHKELARRFKKLYEIINEQIKYHEKTLDPENPRDYIDCFLIKMKEEKDIVNTAFFNESLARTIQNLMFGGTETISSTLRYGLMVLLKHPEVAEKMQQEIDQVIGRDRFPSLEDKKEMPYTEAAISEIQRFCDVLPADLPHLTNRDTIFRGYKIPKGTYVTPLLTSVHYDPKYYAKPKTFNPNNFLDVNGLYKKNDAYLPFSAGRRICPGETLARMELFIFFTSLLQKFNFKPVVPKEELDLSPRECGFGNVAHEYEIRVEAR